MTAVSTSPWTVENAARTAKRFDAMRSGCCCASCTICNTQRTDLSARPSICDWRGPGRSVTQPWAGGSYGGAQVCISKHLHHTGPTWQSTASPAEWRRSIDLYRRLNVCACLAREIVATRGRRSQCIATQQHRWHIVLAGTATHSRFMASLSVACIGSRRFACEEEARGIDQSRADRGRTTSARKGEGAGGRGQRRGTQ